MHAHLSEGKLPGPNFAVLAARLHRFVHLRSKGMRMLLALTVVLDWFSKALLGKSVWAS